MPLASKLDLEWSERRTCWEPLRRVLLAALPVLLFAALAGGRLRGANAADSLTVVTPGVTPGETRPAPSAAAVGATNATNAAKLASRPYLISPDDVIWLKVYQEEDLETKLKVTKDGTVTLPLLGAVTIGGKTVEEASGLIRTMLDRRFLVNPQVSLSIVEYSKRKFTVLGQVQRPGIYEYSAEQPMTLLQAVAMAGGFTRQAAAGKVTVQRIEQGRIRSHKVGEEAMMRDSFALPFEIQPDDTINVGTKLF